jgi:nicotinamidase-related amidase
MRGERTPEREIHPAITPQAGEPVLTKHRADPFSTTNEERARDWRMMDELFKRQGIETLALMGIQTSGCVLSTIRWASGASTHYQLIVLSDCCADRDDEVHRVLMEKMFPRQASVVTAKEFIETIGQTNAKL